MRRIPAELKLRAPILRQDNLIQASENCGWTQAPMQNLFGMLSADLTLVNDLSCFYRGLAMPDRFVLTGPLDLSASTRADVDPAIVSVFRRQRPDQVNLFCTMGSSAREGFLLEAVHAIASLPAEQFHVASGIKSAIRILVGNDDAVTAVDCYVDDTDFTPLLQGFIDDVGPDDEGIIFTDLLGGSVCNKVMTLMDLEGEIPPFAREGTAAATDEEEASLTRQDRADYAWSQVKEVVGKVWPYVLVGVGIGALIHNWIPQEIIESILGDENPFSVVLATLLGAPVYADIFGTLPIAEALVAKGVGVGTVVSFMMSVTVLSIPSLLMKTVLKGVVPSQVKLGIFTVKKAVDRLFKGFKPEDKVIVLVKTPLTILSLSEAGIDFTSLNIGGMGITSSRKTFYQNIACSDDESEAMKELINRGCDITIQIVADDPKTDVARLLK